MRHRLPNVLFAFALLLGQWLTFAHGFEHSPLSERVQSCELCVHVEAMGGALPMAVTLALVLPAAHEAPATPLGVRLATSQVEDARICGPPTLVA